MSTFEISVYFIFVLFQLNRNRGVKGRYQIFSWDEIQTRVISALSTIISYLRRSKQNIDEFLSCKKLQKKFKPLPWACYAIMTEYVGLFFILSICSIQSTFLLFCKILVCVVFAVANNTPYRGPLPGASITFLPLSQLRLVSFYLVLIFFFFYYHIQL